MKTAAEVSPQLGGTLHIVPDGTVEATPGANFIGGDVNNNVACLPVFCIVTWKAAAFISVDRSTV